MASKEDCSKNCKRRNIKPDSTGQSYADFSLDFVKEDKCRAYIGYSKLYKDKKLKVN